MSTAETLLENERSALTHNQIVSRVSGKNVNLEKKSGVGVIVAVAATIGVAGLFFMSSNALPISASERLIEETDIQYADAVESKLIVFQRALINGELPDDTTENLLRKGVEVGYVENGEFIVNNKPKRSLALRLDNKIIEAKDFTNEVLINTALYEAVNAATYSRAAYYYDESAREVFRQIGTSRNNYTSEKDFESTTNALLGEGSRISVNGVEKVEKTRTNENGETETYYEFEETGGTTTSSSDGFIAGVASKSTGASTIDATMNAANTLNIADTISEEQRSKKLFLSFMENISMIKTGAGNDAKVSDVMEYLFKNTESQVVNIETGEVISVSGSMVESPSLYAILSGTPVDATQTKNYSSDKILNLTQNLTGGNITNNNIRGAVTSTDTRVRGSIGRFINNDGKTAADSSYLNAASPIINSSLVNNSFSTMTGVSGGELLVKGAIGVGRDLAKASGATAGSNEAVKSYAKLTSTILALDAKVDRMSRSPFDITSRNTFLGSIVHDLAFAIKPSFSLLTQFGNITRVFGSAIAKILPNTHADDSSERFLANFGTNCETLNSIGAAGSTTCSEIATFDTSTLKDPFSDPGFNKFVEENTTLDGAGNRIINPGSDLANFINYNSRLTPTGVTDGGILQSLKGGSSSISFISNILSMVQDSLDTTDSMKKIATGEAFVNSSSNPDWEVYKYAQRYVSLARATASLKQFTNDKTAYTNIKFFEGNENPVIAFIKSQNSVANN